MISIEVRVVGILEQVRAWFGDRDTHRVSGEASIVQFIDLVAATNTLAL